MKSGISVTLILIFILALAETSKSEDQPPKQLIDEGACPFECCVYRTWETQKNTTAHETPDRSSRIVGIFKADTVVEGLTGEVHVYPSRFIVKKAHGKYKPGDELWVFTYKGEGYFKVWFQGSMFEEDLNFSPYGGSSGERCEQSSRCWGELETELKFTWWVRVKSSEGWVGWSDEPENFSNKDACE